jgi:hypothetical protein
MLAIDTATNTVIATIPIGQGAQAVTYVPGAVPTGDGREGLQPLGLAGRSALLTLASPNAPAGEAPTSVSLFDQGLIQILQAAVTGLKPKSSYVLAFADHPDGSGPLQALSAFVTNPAGGAIVNATGPVRQLVKPNAGEVRRWLVIAPGTPDAPGTPVQLQQTDSKK